MKMKTAKLSGAALDWAVSKCEGFTWEQGDLDAGEYGPDFKPSTNWAHGGPIIEREMIELVPQTPALWDAMYKTQHIPNDGPTPLIAAMLCYVASKLGEEVEIPEELK
jgi:hypothetical protein